MRDEEANIESETPLDVSPLEVEKSEELYVNEHAV